MTFTPRPARAWTGSEAVTDRPGVRGPSLRIPERVFVATVEQLRVCGRGQTECQVLWLGPWSAPDTVTEVVHPVHQARGDGFVVDSAWITALWLDLAARNMGIRAQVHTHPGDAFHSPTDDAFPAVHLPGLLSLVIPDFATGPMTLDRTYLAHLDLDGRFRSVDPLTTLAII
jgi:hypothetical protein